MKQLRITTPHYSHLLEAYATWLSILGYSESTVKNWPVHVRELLHYLESKNITHITKTKPETIKSFINYLQIRSNKTRGGGLSNNHIKTTLNGINNFARYLYLSGQYELEITAIKYSHSIEEPEHLSLDEIKAMYEATFNAERNNTKAVGQRDRAIIAIYYGCGLRRDEGMRLDITDINLEKRLLFVRKGKGNKQRYVPIARTHVEDIKSYIEEGRNWFMYEHSNSYYKAKATLKKEIDTDALFLNNKGQRMRTGHYDRIQKLKERAGIEKKTGLHTLRHSIATHLLQSGMRIEEIAKFLGHSSLESTQIYTHIVSKAQQDERDNSL